jgi:hypothetical protein
MATLTHRTGTKATTKIDGAQFVKAVKSDLVQTFLDKADAYGAALKKRGRDHSRPYAANAR